MSNGYQEKRHNDPVRTAILERLSGIETVVKRIDTALFGNGQQGFIKETQDDLVALDKVTSKHGIYWKLAIKAALVVTASGGGIAYGLSLLK